MSKKIDTRQRILDTASTLFHTRSYAAVGVAAICDRAGVPKGSFFHFFPSKRDLALAVMDRFRQQIEETLIAKAFSPNLPPMERFDRFVKELYAFQKGHTDKFGQVPGCPFGNLALEQATQDEVLRQKVDGCLRSLAEHFQTAIADAVRSRALPPTDEKATGEAMLSYIEGIQLLAKARNDPTLILKLGPVVKTIRVLKKGCFS